MIWTNKRRLQREKNFLEENLKLATDIIENKNEILSRVCEMNKRLQLQNQRQFQYINVMNIQNREKVCEIQELELTNNLKQNLLNEMETLLDRRTNSGDSLTIKIRQSGDLAQGDSQYLSESVAYERNKDINLVTKVEKLVKQTFDLTRKVRSLTKLKQDQAEQIETFKKEQELHWYKYENVERKKVKAERNLVNFELIVKFQKEKIEDDRNTIEQLELSMDKANEEFKYLKNKAKKTVDVLLREVDNLHGQLETIHKEDETKSRCIKQLESKVEALITENQSLADSLGEEKQNLAEVQDELKNIIEQLEMKNQNLVEDIKDSKQTSDKELEKLQNIINMLEETIKPLEDKIKFLLEENAKTIQSYDRELNELQSSASIYKKNIDALEIENKNFADEIQALHEIHAREKQELQNSINNQTSNLKELEFSKRILEDEIQTARKMHQREKNELHRNISNLKETIEVLEEKNRTLEKGAYNLKEMHLKEKQQLEDELHILSTKDKTLEAINKTLTQENLKKEKELENSLKCLRDQMEIEKSKFEADIKEKLDMRDKIQVKYTKLVEKIQKVIFLLLNTNESQYQVEKETRRLAQKLNSHRESITRIRKHSEIHPNGPSEGPKSGVENIIEELNNLATKLGAIRINFEKQLGLFEKSDVAVKSFDEMQSELLKEKRLRKIQEASVKSLLKTLRGRILPLMTPPESQESQES